MESPVLFDVSDGAAWITLNRPEALNALTQETVDGIGLALNRATSDGTVRAIVLTGTGRAFCAGADLKYVRQLAQKGTTTAAFLENICAMMHRLETSPLPIIAAVNGFALAGGLELVLCCDLVVAVRSARFGDAHANYGLLPGGGSSVRLPRKIGPSRAKYLLFTGEMLPAEELKQAGLVNEVADDGALIPVVRQLVDKLANKSPLVLRRMKGLVDDGLEQTSSTALRLELLASEVHTHSRDMQEGLSAFEEKRKPNFTGR